MSLLSKKKGFKAQVLVSLLVSIALFSILAHALFTLVSASYGIVTFVRSRTAAKHLAQEQMEIIRNLPYENIGTVGGIPDGPIQQERTLYLNGLVYTIKTSIIYIDDLFDQTAPNDLLPTDYKRVRAEVSWQGLTSSRNNPVVYITDISPQGIETTQGGGTLSILVYDANAQPVPQATVSIIANNTTPAVNLTLQTSIDGRVILPGAPTCTACYQITITKDGYSSDRTYSTAEVANPDKPYQSSIEGYLTEVSFAIDRLSILTIFSKSGRVDGFEPLGNVSLRIRGDKTIGTNSNDELIYKFDEIVNTNSDGKYELSTAEWGNYQIFRDTSSTWDISGTNPLLPILVLPASDITANISFENHTSNSLIAAFTTQAGTPIASVSARLSEGTFEATSSSGIEGNPDFGQVFFADLSQKIYNLFASASGYLNFSGNISVAGGTNETIILNEE